jgi:hypothetical protein
MGNKATTTKRKRTGSPDASDEEQVDIMDFEPVEATPSGVVALADAIELQDIPLIKVILSAPGARPVRFSSRVFFSCSNEISLRICYSKLSILDRNSLQLSL